MVELNSSQINEKISAGEKFLLDFYAPWCGPCRTQMTILEQSKENLDIPIYKFNIESDRQFAMTYGVRSIPTLKVFNEGEVQKTHTGVMMESQLKTFIV